MSSANYPEPVPAATQLAVMPFLAAVHGALTRGGEVSKLRVTVHRTMSREGKGYLQQSCPYFPLGDPSDWRRTVGRMFPVTQGVIGKAYEKRLIMRTKHFDDPKAFLGKLQESMDRVGETRQLDEVGKAWLAVPFLGQATEVVLILFAECNEINFFARDERVIEVAEMCKGFCQLFDVLQKSPFPNLRNFPLEAAEPVAANRTIYELVQETVDHIAPPKFEDVSSFNYEASVA